ncbi:hypothetical protein GHT06_021733 [Daphnia sinensis]|uniref:Uncharacterized protein n=1 Tax=Daphnia sinensis TaxID=1820382 RepID=A0AAD5PQC3_9CRUS|nr:hypothetical protein GHT06_021733 [Daphnia sinensis]
MPCSTGWHEMRNQRFENRWAMTDGRLVCTGPSLVVFQSPLSATKSHRHITPPAHPSRFLLLDGETKLKSQHSQSSSQL